MMRQLLIFINFVKRFRNRIKVLVINYRKMFEIKDTISKSMKRLQKSVILEMKS